jgi:hypothetical protein
MGGKPGGTVRFEVPVEVAFDYLVDPHNRAAWQSSLRRVENVDGDPRVGQTWVDITKPGLKPAMRTDVLERPHRWSESGTWRFVRADLTLEFEAVGAGACDVHFDFQIVALGPLGALATRVSVPAVAGDLRRAAAILKGAPGSW